MDRLPPLIDALRMLAKQPDAEGVGLLTAERGINEYVGTFDGSARRSELERIRDVARTEAKERPNESSFWTTVEDIASQLTHS